LRLACQYVARYRRWIVEGAGLSAAELCLVDSSSSSASASSSSSSSTASSSTPSVAAAASFTVGSWGAEHCADATTLMRALADAHALGAWLQFESERGGGGTEGVEGAAENHQAAKAGGEGEGEMKHVSTSNSSLVARWTAVAEWSEAQARPLIATVLQVMRAVQCLNFVV
jgi:hypothetical protein